MQVLRVMALAALYAPCAFGAGQVAAWSKWVQDPLHVALQVSITNVLALDGTPVTVILADGQGSVCGGTNGLQHATNGPSFLSNLSVRRKYQLTVVASNLCQMHVSLGVKPPTQLLSAKGANSVPKNYVIYVDGMWGAPPQLMLSGNSGYYSNSFTVEVMDSQGGRWMLEDQSNDPRPGPGDGTGIEIGPGKSLATNALALDWSVALGRTYDGLSAGRLRLRELGLSRDIYTPNVLYYSTPLTSVAAQVELVTTNLNGTLLQVKALQAFVNIVSESTNETCVKFYPLHQVSTNKNEMGIYTNITEPPFVSWSIQNPEPATTNKLLIIESRNGILRTNSLVYRQFAAYGSWTNTTGSGATERIETRDILIQGGATNRFETNCIRYSGSTTNDYKCVEKYHLFDWGWELVETRTDPEGANLVNQFEFCESPGDIIGYGKPSISRFADGMWEKRQYGDFQSSKPGALEYVMRPLNSLPLDPAEATPYNCDVKHYSAISIEAGRSEHTVKHRIADETISWCPVSHIGTYPEAGGMVNEVNYEVNWGYAGHPVGQRILRGGPGTGIGREGHEFSVVDAKSPHRAMYYHGGVFDTTSNTFAVSTNGVAAGPDWRQSTVFWGGGIDTVAIGSADPERLTHLEGEVLYRFETADVGIDLTPFVNTREANVFHNGSLVTKEVSVFTGTNNPQFACMQRFLYLNDSLGRLTNIVRVDTANPSVSNITYEASYRDPNGRDGELLRWEVDERGQRNEYFYDELKRITQIRRVGVSSALGTVPTITTNRVLDAMGRLRIETVASGVLSLTNQTIYDAAGRVTCQIANNGLVTRTSYGEGGRIVTTTLPSGAEVVRENYLERRLHSLTGNGGVHEYHTYSTTKGLASQPYYASIYLIDRARFAAPDSVRWTATGSHYLEGLSGLKLTPDIGGSGVLYEAQKYGDWLHQIIESSASGGAVTRFTLDSTAQPALVNSSLSPNTQSGLDGPDRISAVLRGFARDQQNHWFQVDTNWVFRHDGSAQRTFVSARIERLSGFPSAAVASETTSLDADTNATIVTTYLDRPASESTEVIQIARSSLRGTNISVLGLMVASSTLTVAAPTRQAYDALGRPTVTRSPLGFVATTAYNHLNQVTNSTDFTGNSVSTEYYQNGESGAGMVKVEIRNGKKNRFSYTARGELARTWGDVPYPEERIYSEYGELRELRTFPSGTSWQGENWPTITTGTTNVTTWQYDPHSGLLLSKTDALGRTVSYTYTNGMVRTRSWARMAGSSRVTVTNEYNGFGEVIFQSYNDGTPQVCFDNYDRTGLPRSLKDASGTNILAYDHAGRLVSQKCEEGLLAGVTVTNHFHQYYGRDELKVLGTSPTITHHFGYDATNGRLKSVSSSAFSATYGYLSNSDLLKTTTFTSNNVTALTTTRGWDYGFRLRSIENVAASGAPVSSHVYRYDALNRRTRATLEDGSRWEYGYNDRNELISGRRYWYDASAVSGQQYGYDYDNIGNRESASSGGDTSGANLRTTSYHANALNQYTNIVTLGYEDIVGFASFGTGVTVNSNAADRKVEYFHREIPILNANGAVWTNVTVTCGVTTTNGGLVFPRYSQTNLFDLDGNLTSDGIWTYEWDGENRLKAMSMTNVIGLTNNAERKRLEFAYDYQGRRVQKVVRCWDGNSAFANPLTNLFVYDGWNLIATLSPQRSTLNSFLWGQDLSGTEDGAGGIGGLIALLEYGGGALANADFCAYDGNGNITALVRAGDPLPSARYEYSPYGELIRASGPLARENPFRWSTKFWDEESGLVYYGYRFYGPTLGRWISRDPVEEDGALNLMLFCHNNASSRVDSDGAADFAWDSTGFHIRDGDTTYIPQFNDDGTWNVLQKHNGPFDRDAAKRSLDKIMGDRDLFQRMKNAHTFGRVENGGGLRAWEFFGKGPVAKANSARSLIQQQGRNMWRAARKAPKILGVVGIIAAMQVSSQAAEIGQSYAKNAARGETAYADLDAIDLALVINEMSGNYFLGYLALDILLQ